MQKPSFPFDESDRIRALEAVAVLDTPPEERFDRVTRLACRLFDVPIALVSLVDSQRQWFKSRQGLDATETTREISFCGHAILDSEVFVVPNACEDDRFADNPLVVGAPHIRFYAGCPLAARSGHRLGTLCLIDREPREFSHEDEALLRDLAAMVESELAAFQLATIDQLTGLSNRRGFEILARHALSLARRNGTPLTLVYVDLDGFKAINDQHGHEAGDRALVEMAGLLLHTFRDSDVVARLGGDEFCALLTGATPADLTRPIAALDEALRQRNEPPDAPFALRYSWGAATLDPARHDDLAALLRDADRLMYERKRTRQVG